MIQRRSIIVCFALCAMFAATSVADAGVLCGRGLRCGCRGRFVKVCVATCRTKNHKLCRGEGSTCEIAKKNAEANCGEPVEDCTYRWEVRRRGLFGRCRVEVCAEPVCDTCATRAVKEMAAGTVQARCPTANGGSCYGSGATCDAAIADAKAKCTKPITGPCICWNAYKQKRRGR